MPNIAEHLRNAAQVLQANEILEAGREAASLLAFTLQKNKTFLVAHSEYELSAAEEKRFRELLLRRAKREPFQYITGTQEFYALDFLVTNDVLIPRPETEIIVENAIEILGKNESPKFCEVGVGSGCISVSILHAIPAARAVGLDISEKALKVARANAERHKVSPRLELKISNVFTSLSNKRFDLIVSNPPYIPAGDIEELQAEVRDFEPLAALTDHADGLTIIEKIVGGAPEFLKPDSFLLLEIGFNQADTVRKMFLPEIWRTVKFLPDLQGIPRTVKAQTGA